MTSPTATPTLTLGDEQAPRRVLLLHYAGGSALSLLPLARALHGDSLVALLQLNDRAAPARDFAEAVARTRPEFEALLDRPTVVFGHSLGALVAHALTATLPGPLRALVTDVVLSASRSPATTLALARALPEEPPERTRAELLRLLDRYGGAANTLVDPGLLALALSALDQDMRLVDTYTPPEGDPTRPTGTAFHLWRGAEDDDTPEEEVSRWRLALPPRARTRVLPGGHFYPLQYPDATGALRHLVTVGKGPA